MDFGPFLIRLQSMVRRGARTAESVNGAPLPRRPALARILPALLIAILATPGQAGSTTQHAAAFEGTWSPAFPEIDDERRLAAIEQGIESLSWLERMIAGAILRSATALPDRIEFVIDTDSKLRVLEDENLRLEILRTGEHWTGSAPEPLQITSARLAERSIVITWKRNAARGRRSYEIDPTGERLDIHYEIALVRFGDLSPIEFRARFEARGPVERGDGSTRETGSEIAALRLSAPPISPGKVHELQLDSVGIREEHRIVVLPVLRIVRRCIQNGKLLADEEAVERVNVRTRPGLEREVMKADLVPVELLADFSLGRAHGERHLPVRPRRVAGRMLEASEPQLREHALVEPCRARKIVHRDVQVLEAENFHRLLHPQEVWS